MFHEPRAALLIDHLHLRRDGCLVSIAYERPNVVPKQAVRGEGMFNTSEGEITLINEETDVSFPTVTGTEGGTASQIL